MNDLQIQNYLLSHPKIHNTIEVSEKEIKAQLQPIFFPDEESIRKQCELIKTKTGCKVARIGYQIFVLKNEKLTVAQRNAYHFKNLTETR